jgi:hypothetical protein
MRAGIPHRVGRRNERQVRHHDFVIRLHTSHQQRDVNRRRAVDGGDRVAASDRGREIALEPIHVGAGGRDPSGVEAFLDVRPLGAADFRDRQRDPSLGGPGARFNRHGVSQI